MRCKFDIQTQQQMTQGDSVKQIYRSPKSEYYRLNVKSLFTLWLYMHLKVSTIPGNIVGDTLQVIQN